MKVIEGTDASGHPGWFVEDDQGRRIAGLFYTAVAARRWITWTLKQIAATAKAEGRK